jgi:hypothetical protein
MGRGGSGGVVMRDGGAEFKGCFPKTVAWGSAEQRRAALFSLRAALSHVQLP